MYQNQMKAEARAKKLQEDDSVKKMIAEHDSAVTARENEYKRYFKNFESDMERRQ